MKIKIGQKKSEEKDKFECPRNESLVFQKGYPNCALTQLCQKKLLCI